MKTVPTGRRGSSDCRKDRRNKTVAHLYGVHPVLEALKSGDRRVEKIVLVKGRHGREIEELVSLARSLRIPFVFETRGELDRAAGTDKHQGVLARVAARSYVGLEDILARARTGDRPALVVVLDHIEDPRNLGAVARTADGAGAHGVVIPHRRSAGFTEASAKAAAGALEYVPVARVTNVGQALDRLKEAGLWVYGLDASGTREYTQADLSGPVAIVAGGEGRGLGSVVKKACDDLIRIPMIGSVTSLNVSVAVAVVCYEVVRQRAFSASSGKPPTS